MRQTIKGSFLKLFQATACVSAFGCFTACKAQRNGPNSHEIAWNGVAEHKPIEFRVDGREVGRGKVGLERVLDFMKKCDKRTKLYFDAPTADWYVLSTEYHVDDHPLPFEVFRSSGDEDFAGAFFRIEQELDLKIVFREPRTEVEQ